MLHGWIARLLLPFALLLAAPAGALTLDEARASGTGLWVTVHEGKQGLQSTGAEFGITVEEQNIPTRRIVPGTSGGRADCLVVCGGEAQVLAVFDEADPRIPGADHLDAAVAGNQDGGDRVQPDRALDDRRLGIHGQVADLANRRTHEIALQAYNLATGTWTNAFEGSAEIKANSKDIYVFRDFAFVTCHGGFFVVRLDTLPERMQVVDEVVARLPGAPQPKTVASVVANPAGTHIFVATDGPLPKAGTLMDECAFPLRGGQNANASGRLVPWLC